MSIRRNYLYSVSYQILLVIVPLITVPYLSRILGAETLGIYSYTNSVAAYFYLFSMLGISNYGNRTTAQIRDNKKELNIVTNEILCMQIGFGLIVFCGYCIYLIYLYSIQSDYFRVSMIWALYILSGVFDISWFFWGMENFKLTVLKSIIVKIITTIGIFVFIKEKEDLWLYVLLIAGSPLLCQIILWKYITRIITFTRVAKKNIIKHLKNNFILFIPVIAVSIYTIMDKLMLGNICSIRQLGYYDNVQKIMTLPTGIITALGTVMLPRMSNIMSKGENSKVIQAISVSMQFTCFFSIGFAAGLAGTGKVFSVIYFGQEFYSCGRMMIFFAPTVVCIAWANVIRTQYLIPAEKDRIYIISVFLGAIVNVLVNLLLIPKLYAIGAIIGTICAEAMVAITQTVCVRNDIEIKRLIYDSTPFLIVGIVMFIIVYSLGEYMGISIVTLLVQIIIGAVFYIGTATVVLLKSKSLLGVKIQTEIWNLRQNCR